MTERIKIKVWHGDHVPRSKDHYKDPKGTQWFITKVVGVEEILQQQPASRAAYEYECEAVKV